MSLFGHYSSPSFIIFSVAKRLQQILLMYKFWLSRQGRIFAGKAKAMKRGKWGMQ